MSNKVSSNEIDAPVRPLTQPRRARRQAVRRGRQLPADDVPPERCESFGEALQVHRCVNFEIDFDGSIVNSIVNT
jgi:hypothetical protein